MFSEMANSPEHKGNTYPYIWLTNGLEGKGTPTLYISWVFWGSMFLSLNSAPRAAGIRISMKMEESSSALPSRKTLATKSYQALKMWLVTSNQDP